MRSLVFAAFVAPLLGISVSCAIAHGPTTRAAEVVGTWRLERYADTPEGLPTVHAFGTAPVGLMVFTPEGYFSVSLMRNPPSVDEPSTDPDPDACIPAWYCSYFGTYSVDATGTSWTTRVLGGNIPHYLGTEQARSFSIRGDRLVISEEYVAEGRKVKAERVLVRVTPRGFGPP
jgi:Lipocalin-like domain